MRGEQPPLRQLLGHFPGARGHFVTVATLEQIAVRIEDWFRATATDGFNLMPPGLPSMLEPFIAEVVTILQRRGVFRTACTGEPLGPHYRLPRSHIRFG